MKKEKNEFLGLLCNLYLIVLLVALPLYTGEGYWKLGDTKYILFRNVSCLCLGCWLVLGMPGRVRAAREYAGSLRHTAGQERHWFSAVDCAVAAYGGCVMVSALCSSYGQLAWTGYDEWYMGAVSQLMFVGIYFFVSRQYDGSKYPLYLGEGAFFLVTLLGLLHRFGIDPLGLQTGWNNGDWEYNHMLSTLGNINWLCGFYSVALAWLLADFMGEKKRWRQVLLYIGTVATFVLLGIQGSQGGLLILGVGVLVCIWLGWRQKITVRKLALLLAGFCICMPLTDWLTKLREEVAAVAADGNIFEYTVWYGWVMAGAVCMVFYFASAGKTLQKCGSFLEGKWQRWKSFAAQRKSENASGSFKVLLLTVAGTGIVIVCFLCLSGIDDRFGSGRGFLWRIALEGFSQADWKEKFIGAGPDCYGEAVFHRLGTGTDVWKGEHWEGAVFTNAHNEVLSQLVNVGILGTVSYLAIFLTGLWRYSSSAKDGRRFEHVRWLGVLAIAMYGAHSLVSFQQVLNAPLLFVTLGLCEYGMRCKCEKKF